MKVVWGKWDWKQTKRSFSPLWRICVGANGQGVHDGLCEGTFQVFWGGWRHFLSKQRYDLGNYPMLWWNKDGRILLHEKFPGLLTVIVFFRFGLGFWLFGWLVSWLFFCLFVFGFSCLFVFWFLLELGLNAQETILCVWTHMFINSYLYHSEFHSTSS